MVNGEAIKYLNCNDSKECVVNMILTFFSRDGHMAMVPVISHMGLIII